MTGKMDTEDKEHKRPLFSELNVTVEHSAE